MPFVSSMDSMGLSPFSFSSEDKDFLFFKDQSFKNLALSEKNEEITKRILLSIENHEGNDFLLIPMASYINRLHNEKIQPLFHFSDFEFHFNRLVTDVELQLKIRGKIAGKYIPRSTYQVVYPVGMGQSYKGVHVVSAHTSPDLDTTVASFWGWLDAFSCRLSSGRHLWNLPGGPPKGQVEINLLFENYLGSSFFDAFASSNRIFSLEAADLMGLESWEGVEQTVRSKASYEEVKNLFLNHNALKVVDDQDNVLGFIGRSDFTKKIWGTVSLRDFSSRSEGDLPSYLDIISIVDHHKSSFTTPIPSCIYVNDAQSSNTLLAEKAFQMNDLYSLGSIDPNEINRLIGSLKESSHLVDLKILSNLLNKKRISLSQSDYFISPQREFLEYLHFFYAILDDTDLLAKVTPKDVNVCCELVNRLKSLASRKEEIVISLDDLAMNPDYAQQAAKRLLQHEDVYSLYSRIYEAKERHVEMSIIHASRGEESSLFMDTKEQNGCCRVGQSKLFKDNFTSFHLHQKELRLNWLRQALTIYEGNPLIDLHIHMISTVSGGKEAYEQKDPLYTHKDEMWIWAKNQEHLRGFLSGFLKASPFNEGTFEIKVFGAPVIDMNSIKYQYKDLDLQKGLIEDKDETLIVLRFKPGLVNSRKTMVSPYLPKIG